MTEKKDKKDDDDLDLGEYPAGRDKNELIKRRVEAQIEKDLASAAASRAEVRDYEASVLKQEAEAEKTRLESQQTKIASLKIQREYDEELTFNKYHHTYHYTSGVDESSMKACITTLNMWDRMDPGCDIEIVFSSPGGSVVDGMVLFDFIRGLSKKKHKVTTGCLGYAASMAGILLQAGDVRWMGPESYILIHEVSFGTHGKFGEVEDELKWIKKVQERILDVFADRCKKAGVAKTASKPFTRVQLAEGWNRKDWWLDSDESLKGGLVDEIR